MPAITFSVDALPAFLNCQQYRALAVHAHDVGLRRGPVAHPGDVFYVDRGAADGFDRNAVQVRNRLRCSIRDVNVVFPGADFGSTRRQNQVLRADRVDDVEWR